MNSAASITTVELWSFILTIASVVIGLAGFIFTIWIIFKTKTAAESAAEAARDAKQEINKMESIGSLNEIDGLISMIKLALSHGADARLIADKCEQVRKILQRNRTNIKLQDDETQIIFQDMITSLREFEDRLIKNGQEGKKTTGLLNYYPYINDHLDQVQILINKIKE